MANSLSGTLGDIFWDLPPWITYTPGYELGCSLFVANPTDTEKQYSLMTRLTSDTQVISEEAIKVYGYAWFAVDPGDWETLRGALRFEDTNVALTVLLYERESGEVVDSVSTLLVAPTVAAWPPGWPESSGTVPQADWISLLLPLVMLAIMAGMMTSALEERDDEERQLATGRER